MPLYKGSTEIAGGKLYKATTNIQVGYKQTAEFFVNSFAVDQGFEIFVFALPEHHNSFLGMVRGEASRLFTPVVNSETVFMQIRQIFEDLCIGG